jgi:hypothetical protein
MIRAFVEGFVSFAGVQQRQSSNLRAEALR